MHQLPVTGCYTTFTRMHGSSVRCATELMTTLSYSAVHRYGRWAVVVVAARCVGGWVRQGNRAAHELSSLIAGSITFTDCAFVETDAAVEIGTSSEDA
eukprot:SAG31_NODE_37_length_31616_cov_38.688359_3_plen_98_part_00